MGEAPEEKIEQPAGESRPEGICSEQKTEEAPAKKKEKKPKVVRIPENELEELRGKASLADEYYDRLLRLQAELENFRKRKEREKLDLIKYATEELVCELVPILCNLERALVAAEKVPQVKRFVEGVELILKQLKNVLKDRGVEEICPVNAPFDPLRHEVIEKVVTDEHPHGHVLEVLQTGYALSGRVVQPAAVKVAAAPAREAETLSGQVQEGEAAPAASAEGKVEIIEENETDESEKIEEGHKNG